LFRLCCNALNNIQWNYSKVHSLISWVFQDSVKCILSCRFNKAFKSFFLPVHVAVAFQTYVGWIEVGSECNSLASIPLSCCFQPVPVCRLWLVSFPHQRQLASTYVPGISSLQEPHDTSWHYQDPLWSTEEKFPAPNPIQDLGSCRSFERINLTGIFSRDFCLYFLYLDPSTVKDFRKWLQIRRDIQVWSWPRWCRRHR
jgi:hypothetical protein